MTRITTASVFGLAMLLSNISHADVISDNLAKAEKSVVNAQKRLAAAQDCASRHDECLQEMITKAETSSKRAADKLAALTADQPKQ